MTKSNTCSNQGQVSHFSPVQPFPIHVCMHAYMHQNTNLTSSTILPSAFPIHSFDLSFHFTNPTEESLTITPLGKFFQTKTSNDNPTAVILLLSVLALALLALCFWWFVREYDFERLTPPGWNGSGRTEMGWMDR